MKLHSRPKRVFTLIELLDLIVLNWPWIVLFIFAGAVSGFGYSIQKPPVYESFAVVQVDHNAEEAVADTMWLLGVRRVYFLEEQTRLLEGIANSDEVFLKAKEILTARNQSLPQDQEEFFKNALLPHPAQGNWRFVFRESNSETAAQWANAWSEAFVDVLGEKLVIARQMRAQRTQTSYHAGKLASQELLCTELPDLISKMEEREKEMQGIGPDESPDVMALWWLEEITAQAGLQGSQNVYDLETNKEAIVYLQYVISMAGEELSSCKVTIENLGAALDTSLELETELIEESGGFSPYLEVSVKNTAAPAEQPLVQPARTVLLGSILGLMAGIIWLFVRLLQQERLAEES